MLNRIDLTPDQVAILVDAMDNESDGRIAIEMGTNLTILVNSFLSARYLPIPVENSHAIIPGDERDYAIQVLKGDNAFVILQQITRENDTPFREASPVEVNVVLKSTLDFMPESRTEDWPLRVRRTLLEATQWIYDQGQAMDPTLKQKFKLWQELDDPKKNLTFFGNDLQGIRQVLAGKATVSELWGDWALDQSKATYELQSCLSMRGVVASLLPASTRKQPH